MNRFIALTILMFFVLSCGNQKNERSSTPEQVEGEVKVMLEKYLQDISENGVAAEVAYLDSAGDFFWVPPGFNSAISYDSVMSVLNSAEPTNMGFSWKELKIQAMSPELAVYTGKVQATNIDSAGVETSNILIETGVLVKREAGWKLYCGQTGLLQ